MENLLPQFYPSSWKEEFNLIGSDFSPGVCLGLIERVDGGYSFVTKDDLAQSGKVFDELLSVAVSHLANLKDGVEIHLAKPMGATVAWLTSEDNFAAVRMLLPQVKSKLKSELGEHFLFSIPSRDLCLFWNSDAPTLLTEKHAKEASEDFESEEYNLTPNVLVYSEEWPCVIYKAAG
jgi:hypothetical protein